jgi:hypothetical protein
MGMLEIAAAMRPAARWGRGGRDRLAGTLVTMAKRNTMGDDP